MEKKIIVVMIAVILLESVYLILAIRDGVYDSVESLITLVLSFLVGTSIYYGLKTLGVIN